MARAAARSPRSSAASARAAATGPRRCSSPSSSARRRASSRSAFAPVVATAQLRRSRDRQRDAAGMRSLGQLFHHRERVVPMRPCQFEPRLLHLLVDGEADELRTFRELHRAARGARSARSSRYWSSRAHTRLTDARAASSMSSTASATSRGLDAARRCPASSAQNMSAVPWLFRACESTRWSPVSRAISIARLDSSTARSESCASRASCASLLRAIA